MEQTTNSFLYRQLRTTPLELRLVVIHPSTFSSPIRCSLKYVFLGDKPEFEALSYVWGDPLDTLPICLDGKTFKVTKNLQRALRNLRSEDTVRTFWIDAICINQSDITEQGQQVQHMGNFYETAKRTTVWLGHETENIRLAFEHILEEAKLLRVVDALAAYDRIMERLTDYYHRIVEDNASTRELGIRQGDTELFALRISQRAERGQDYASLLAERDRYLQEVDVLMAMLYEIRKELGQGGSCHVRAAFIESSFHEQDKDASVNSSKEYQHISEADMRNFPPTLSETGATNFPTTLSMRSQLAAVQIPRDVEVKVQEGICDILEKPWWERVWVVQEIGVSRDVVFQCGNVAATWTEFYSYFVHTSAEVAGGSYPSVLSILSMRKHQKNAIQDPQRAGMELIDLLQRFRYCKATNPLDNVYALLGLAEDFRNEAYPIDYSLTPRQLYTELAKLFIMRQNSLAIFGHILDAEEELQILCNTDLPSWVPNWSAPTTCSPFQNKQVAEDSTNQFYTASGLTSVSLMVPLNPDDLVVKGFVVESISHLCPSAGDILEVIDGLEFCTSQQHLTVIQHWEDKALGVSSDEDPYDSGCGRLEAFWRTLIGDAIGDLRATQEAEKMFNVWSGRATAPKDDVYYTEAYVNAVHRASSNRRFVLSRKGYMGLALVGTKIGDLICVLFGSQTPLIIREQSTHYTLVGACYVHGIMDGEAMQEQQAGKHELQYFVLR